MFTTAVFSMLALAASLLTTTSAAPTTAVYKHIADYAAPNFFEGFTPYTGTDPTDGFISYVDTTTAIDQGLMGWIYHAETNVTNAFIGVDHTSVQPDGRQSVRLTSNKIFDVGTLTVIDLKHIPVGPDTGLWPAVWYLGTEGTWPASGEMDILEYVNPAGNTTNAMTLHTSPGCTVDQAPSALLGTLLNSNCSASDNDIPGSEGCSVTAPSDYQIATAGPAFNSQGGGIYVHLWTEEGITIWLFPRESLPADIKSGQPNPAGWTQKPLAKFSGSGCDFTKSFTPMQLIINVDVCGQWAGNVYPGGIDACNAFAANNPQAYKDAYFEFGSIVMYSKN